MTISDHQELRNLIKRMDSERHDLIEHITAIMWHMRGSLSRGEAWSLSDKERRIILKQIEERVKAVEKTNLPML